MDKKQHEHLKKLNHLSANIHEVLREIMQLAHAEAQQAPWMIPEKGAISIRLIEQNLWIDRVMIPLSTRPKTLCLLQAFFQRPRQGLTKEEIIEAVYGPQGERSLRFLEAQDHSLTKLLSRTRSYLEFSVAHAYPYQPIDWLVFHIKTRRYHLYQLRDLDPSDTSSRVLAK